MYLYPVKINVIAEKTNYILNKICTKNQIFYAIYYQKIFMIKNSLLQECCYNADEIRKEKFNFFSNNSYSINGIIMFIL